MASKPSLVDVGPGAVYLGRALTALTGLLVVTTGLPPDAVLRVVWPFFKLPHALLMGATGSGKTSLLRVVIWYIITSPYQVAVCLADGIPDADSFRMFDGQPRVAGITSGTDGTSAMIEGVYKVYRERLEQLGRARQQAYTTRQRAPWPEPTPLILVVDEYLLYILDVSDHKPRGGRSHRDRIINMLREMGLNGRKVNVLLLLAMQRAGIGDANAGLPGALKASLKCRIASTGEAGMDSTEARIAFDDDSVAKRVPMREGTGFIKAGAAEVGFQVPWYADLTDPKHTSRMTDEEIAAGWDLLPRGVAEAIAAARELDEGAA